MGRYIALTGPLLALLLLLALQHVEARLQVRRQVGVVRRTEREADR